ncbi:MAG: aldehyde dehydrogenase family protein [Bacteroidia bacterium]|nr:aldehyde dehydrogenase family protein [Bacteroidia bacterium]MDW8088757.1 aldehyde dehydrogenase family protein [Bacteroidia bacterium]
MYQPLLVGGQWVPTPHVRTLYAPYTRTPLAEVAYATPDHIQQVIAQLSVGQKAAAQLPTHQRYTILDRLARWISDNAEAIARGIAEEAGKPLRYARAEVQRAYITVTLGRDLVRLIEGELLPGDLSPATEGRWLLVRRMPLGPLLAITPFNFPLNLVLHKIVPAIVAGCAITLKPAPQAPLTAYRVGTALLEAGWPPEALSIISAEPAVAEILVRSPAYRILSFTGSAAVGWHLQTLAVQKKVILELGGSAAVIVHDTEDLSKAAQAIAEAAYLYAGQVCIAVQRIFVHRSLYDDFLEAYRAATYALVCGDPLHEETHLSSIIDERNFRRITDWLTEARLSGAHELIPPVLDPERRLITPGLLSELSPNIHLAQEEAFAPLAEIAPYDLPEEAFQKVNSSPYGLQAGIYTASERLLRQAFEYLEVGGLIHNAPPTLRIDSMPYGGMKNSGLGREGVKYAFLEYTVPKVLVW